MNKVTLLCTTLLLWGVMNLKADCGVIPENISMLTYFCDSPAPVCLDIPLSELSEYDITVDGQPFFGQIAGCNFDTLFNYTYSLLFGQGNNGPYLINSWMVNGQDYSFEFTNIADLVAQMNTIDPAGDWTHDANSLVIYGGVPGSNYTNMSATALQNNLPATIGLSFGLNPLGTQIALEAGEYEIIFTNTTANCADTLALSIVCFTPSPTDTITNTIAADENPYVVCLDTTGLPGNIISIENICPDDASGFVNFLIEEETYCVKYQGVKCNGLAKACIVVCDDLGLCDTTIFEITVDNTLCDLEPAYVQENVLINFSEIFCLDTTELPGMILNMENVCGNAGTGNVDFDLDLDNFCLTYTGINAGKDTACVVLTDEYGNQDTTFFCIQVTLPQPQFIIDTLLYGENGMYCLEDTELAGNNFTFFNNCEDFSGLAVEFGTNDVSLCAEASTIGLGTEQGCFVICDEFGVCDTTYILITVADNGDPCAFNPSPSAIDDTAETLQNTAISVRILDNDSIPDCSPTTMKILETPDNGIAVANNNGQTVDYLPANNFCGEDSFTYELCNDNGCDTAIVIISVNCIPNDEIRIYNAFSPNGDGISDFFKIVNIENFPQNELKVYNRWGNLVFRQLSYANTWDDTYKNTLLPDGTYFYKLSIENQKDYTGYIQIAK